MKHPCRSNHFRTPHTLLPQLTTMPTDQITGKQRQTTKVERVKIIELSAQGFSYQDIAKKIAVSKATVSRVLQQWKKDETLEAASRTGRPQALNKRDKRRIYRLSDVNPYASLAELTADVGLGISSETVARILRASGRYVRWARHKPYISDEC